MSEATALLLGVDTGGTFTDFVLLERGQLRIHKVLSTPDAPERAIVEGIKALRVSLAEMRVVHGSTVATNAVLEGKGVPVAYITNKGLTDVLTIGRQARAELYNLNPEPVAPPVPEALCFAVSARLAADGTELKPVDTGELEALVQRIADSGVRAVAINLLFSFLNPAQEQAIAQALPKSLYVSRSSEVLAEYKEYERGIATWINASVGPLMQSYLNRLQDRIAPASVMVMQSSGGTLPVDQAGQHAVRLLLSGPAGGLMGARYIARQAGIEKLLTFDMGGTSTDVALIDGEVRLTSEGHMGRYPIGVPMVDMDTIGAGGGSLAGCDAGGLLQVGPESAGAMPGPVCYGNGGTQATVTDANVVLGRLPLTTALGGSLQLDKAAAEGALDSLGEKLGLGAVEAAEGVIRLANEHMARALRVISVERGVDVSDYALTSFGGAGGLHVCALADLLGMRRALVPVSSGVLSALGMLSAPVRRDQSRTLSRLLPDLTEAEVSAVLAELEAALRGELGGNGEWTVLREVDLRYRGQSSTLNLPWSKLEAMSEVFHQAHQQQFGHRMDIPVELVNARVHLIGPEPTVSLPELAEVQAEQQGLLARVPVAGVGEVPCYQREELGCGQCLQGPAIVIEKVATTWLEPGWRARVDRLGNLLLDKE